ncbi:MAG: Lpg1974 family pore-forming outer membrane protein [Gemmataceae bacterium]
MRKWTFLLLAGAFLIGSVGSAPAQQVPPPEDDTTSFPRDPNSYTRGGLFARGRGSRKTIQRATWRSSSARPAPVVVGVSGAARARALPRTNVGMAKPRISSSTIGCPDGGCGGGCDSVCIEDSWTEWMGSCGSCNHPCFSLYADYLYMTTRNVDVPLGVPFNGATLAAAPVGTVAVADPHYTSGFRVGGSYFLTGTTAIEANFAWLDSNTSAQFDAPNGTSFRSFIFHPTTPLITSDAEHITSRYDIDFRFADVAYKGVLWKNCNGYLGYLAGVRYAHINQDLFARYEVLGDRFVETQINFDGIGPRIGLDGEYRTCCGVFGYARGVLNVLAGHWGGSYRQEDVNAGTEAMVDYGDDRIVLNPELEIGVGWTGCQGRLRVSGGYYISAFYNSMTTPGLILATQSDNYSTVGDNNRDTLVFDGLVARIEVRY